MRKGVDPLKQRVVQAFCNTIQLGCIVHCQLACRAGSQLLRDAR